MATEEQLAQNQGRALPKAFGETHTVRDRCGQKLNITGRWVNKLGFYLHRLTGAHIDVYASIRKVSDDSVICSGLIAAADTLTVTPTYRELAFDKAYYINEEVRILIEYAGTYTRRISMRCNSPSTRSDFLNEYLDGVWSEDVAQMATFRYTYGVYVAPSVFTAEMTNITETTATANGIIIHRGEPVATQYGHCWSNSVNPPTTSQSKTSHVNPAGTGAYESSLTGLNSGQTYWVRAYIINALGTYYGGVESFGPSSPIVTTVGISSIGLTTATAVGKIIEVGDPVAYQHGHIWKRSGTPTLDINAGIYDYDGITENGVAVAGGYTSKLTDLEASTPYYISAYAISIWRAGVYAYAYGVTISFRTDSPFSAIVNTENMYVIGETTATAMGDVIEVGLPPATQHGHIWKKESTVLLIDDYTGITENGVPVKGIYYSNLTGLEPDTPYYVRAYVVNADSTISYGNMVLFTTGEFDIPIGGLKPGSVVIRGTKMRYVDKYGQERFCKGTLVGASPLTPGSIAMRGRKIRYIDAYGDERFKEGTLA